MMTSFLVTYIIVLLDMPGFDCEVRPARLRRMPNVGPQTPQDTMPIGLADMREGQGAQFLGMLRFPFVREAS